MSVSASVLTPEEALLGGFSDEAIRMAVVASFSGAMGFAAPGIVNSARLAAESAAERHGRPVELVLIDAGRGARAVAVELGAVAAAGAIAGVVGTHTSDVRVAIERELDGRLPYVFTPPHELDAVSGPTVFLGIGPTGQILAPLTRLIERERVRRWMLVGNDYIWPRAMHQAAVGVIPALGGTIVGERLVPVGHGDAAQLVRDTIASGAEGVLVSLIGRDGIGFHRAFQRHGAGSRIVRLCTALDEACLMSAGGDDQGALFSAMPSFVLQDDERHRSMVTAYDARFGRDAPLPGAYAEGCHDGVRLLADHLAARTAPHPALVGAAEVRLARADGISLAPVSGAERL